MNVPVLEFPGFGDAGARVVEPIEQPVIAASARSGGIGGRQDSFRLRQVINVFPAKRAAQPRPEQEVLTKRDETQNRLIEILGW